MGGNHQKLRENSGKMMLKIPYEPCLNLSQKGSDHVNPCVVSSKLKIEET